MTFGKIPGRFACDNPWIAFAPFLLFYIILVIVFRNNALESDADRYLMYARNLLAGHYSPKEEVLLWNGPGYPLLLAPFVALGAPPLVMTLLNAAMYYLSVVLLCKTIRLYASRGVALAFGAYWGLYFTAFKFLPTVLTEALTMFLTALLAYSVSLAYRKGGGRICGRYLWLAGGVLGFLALTKVMFGYVLLVMLALGGFCFLLSREKKNPGKATLIVLIALAVTLPYLIYTYHLTGRYFYWANSGGMSLYWMSTPYENEYGDWQSFNFSEGFKGRNTAAIRRNHEADYVEVLRFKGVEMDSLFKAKAIDNIKNHPQKYLVNWIANVNRLFFGFPNSYQYENLKFFKMFPNIFLLGLLLYSLFVSVFNLRRIPFELIFLMVLTLVYLGLSSLASAYPRMLLAITPILLFWIAFCVDRTLRFHLTFRSGDA